MGGRSFDPAVRGNRPLEMSKPTYRELATNFTLWCKFVLLEEQVSEREFNEMSIDEKLDILQGCFGHEIRHASVKECVDKMQAFWNWKLFLLVGASLIILADG
jgi:hypothetical protein